MIQAAETEKNNAVMTDAPLVSVVIPTYSRPDMLARTVKSVLGQDYKTIEIIVVDDNDPYTEARRRTEDIMKSFEGCPNVFYIRHDKNRNGSAARNTGIRNAHGEYIAFLDDDDEFLPGKITRQVSCLMSSDADTVACYTGYCIVSPGGKIRRSEEKRSGNLYIEALMRTLYVMPGSNLLARKSAVDAIGGFDESFRRNQDLEFLVRLLDGKKIAYADGVYLKEHDESDLEQRKQHYSFLKSEEYTAHYMKVFGDRINALSEHDRRRVLTVISLERAKSAVMSRAYSAAFGILRENNVGVINIIKYAVYLIRRRITNEHYGFTL